MILYTAFKGKTNSSKILLDYIDVSNEKKLYLTNSFSTSVKEFVQTMKKKQIDCIFSFGQLKLPKNMIKIEVRAIGEEIYTTSYDYTKLIAILTSKGYKVQISYNTNYLCNHIYYNGLKYIKEKSLDCQMLFIHLPKINNIDSIQLLASVFKEI